MKPKYVLSVTAVVMALGLALTGCSRLPSGTTADPVETPTTAPVVLKGVAAEANPLCNASLCDINIHVKNVSKVPQDVIGDICVVTAGGNTYKQNSGSGAGGTIQPGDTAYATGEYLGILPAGDKIVRVFIGSCGDEANAVASVSASVPIEQG